MYNYASAPYFEDFKDSVESVFEKKFEYLIDLNTEIIKFVKNELEIKSKIVFSSELKISKKDLIGFLIFARRLVLIII